MKKTTTLGFYVRIADIEEAFMSSHSLASNSKVTYIHYITVGEIMINHQDMFSLLDKIPMDATVTKMLGITHFDVSRIYIFSKINFDLMLQPADALFKKDRKPAPFYEK